MAPGVLPRMADPYIDNRETLSYGPFAVDQIQSLVVDLDPDFKKALATVSGRLTEATTVMHGALTKAGEIDLVTYKSAEGVHDAIAAARSELRRCVSYADSRAGGAVIIKDLLGGEALSTVVRRRPAKLSGALGHAISAVAKHKSQLPEHAKWSASLTTAKDAIDALNTSVRQSRNERREATPETAAARTAWLTAYAAAKLIVEGVLRYAGKTALMSEIFDDLAEVHRAAGVSDGDVPVETAPANPK
ncbi:MAG: hypothetical protein ABJE95_31420 [Byssovorax sp.]